MKMTNELQLQIPLAMAWEALNDMARVARCAPGAKLLESHEDDSHIGTISVKLGPVALSFKGMVSFQERNPAEYRVIAHAHGNEEKARGSAKADVVFTLHPNESGTRLMVESDITLAGSIAQYGRGVGIFQSTVQVIMAQFAKNLEADLNAGADAKLQTDISGAKVLAEGIWNAGKGFISGNGKTSI